MIKKCVSKVSQLFEWIGTPSYESPDEVLEVLSPLGVSKLILYCKIIEHCHKHIVTKCGLLIFLWTPNTNPLCGKVGPESVYSTCQNYLKHRLEYRIKRLNPYWRHYGTITECHFRKQNPRSFGSVIYGNKIHEYRF